MGLASIATIPTFLLAIGINVLMLVIRRACELKWPTLADHTPRSLAENIWERIVLPTLPAVIGALFGLLVRPAGAMALSGFAYPEVVVGLASRILYGVFVGFFSGYLYKVAKFLLKKEWNIDLPFPGDSLPVPGPAPAVEIPVNTSIPVIAPPPDSEETKP